MKKLNFWQHRAHVSRSSALLIIFFLCASFASAHLTTLTQNGIVNSNLLFSTDPPNAGEQVRVMIELKNATDWAPITDLDIVHERKMHIFVIGEDLTDFSHVHIEDTKQPPNASLLGDYYLDYTFKKGGNYAIVLDYTLFGQNMMDIFYTSPSGFPKMKSNDQLPRLEDEVDGYKITLQTDSLISGRESQLNFKYTKDGNEVRNIQPYLGSELHLLAIKDDLTNPGHTHAYIPAHYVHFGAMPQIYYGPTVPVRYTFPIDGKYVLFAQSQIDGKIVTSSFIVKVESQESVKELQNLMFAGAGFAVFLGLVAFVLYRFSKIN